ncbi:PAS domain-containing protein [Roseibacterium sp. SDUM158017]|uniref:PAS domain-containing protein n=1 Tax=Roseicyclus salinarum TaxID=3036773 RepID=UPI00241541C6|nr:PAS domain-containing protein [Roseibacterium sp. SDUM158017]MDG4650203.1 PAS domain-containing protein [Roseibacterium sp. SDUM158017]
MPSKVDQETRAPSMREVQHRAVAELGRLALEGRSLDMLLERAVQELGRCLDVEYVSLLGLSPDGRTMTVRAGIGWKPGVVGRSTIATDAGTQAGYTLSQEDPVVVSDFVTETRLKPSPLLVEHGITCGASIVVGPTDNPWGILGIHDSRTDRCSFDDYDLDFIRSVANIVWLSIRNVRDREEAERERRALRSFADAMPILFSVVNADGRYEFVNKAYRSFGWAPSAIIGRRVADVLGEEVYQKVEPHAKQALAGHVVSFENRIVVGPDGERRDVLATFAPRHNLYGETDGYYAAVVDISDQKRRQREVLERNQQYRAIADSIPYGIWTCDPAGRLTYVSESFLEVVELTFEEAADFGWLSKLLPEDAAATREAWSACVERRGNWEREHRFVGSSGSRHDILAIARPVFDEEGELFGYVGLNLDITDRKRREETLALVSAELDHRVKNIFSLVITIARQASRSAKDVDAFRDSFEGRLRALASAHQLIAENQWQDMSLCRLVKAELAPYGGPDTSRWTVEGPLLKLPVAAVQPLALALHELATNAAKYGAFSGPEGTVSVRWSLSSDGALDLVWEEAGLTGISPPKETGFGSRVLQQVLVMQLGAEVSVDFRETGLRVGIVLPPDGIREE